MLFPFPLELFAFPFPFPFLLVAQNYSHSHGNPMGIPIPMGIPWESHGNGNSHSHAHLYPGPTGSSCTDAALHTPLRHIGASNSGRLVSSRPTICARNERIDPSVICIASARCARSDDAIRRRQSSSSPRPVHEQADHRRRWTPPY